MRKGRRGWWVDALLEDVNYDAKIRTKCLQERLATASSDSFSSNSFKKRNTPKMNCEQLSQSFCIPCNLIGILHRSLGIWYDCSVTNRAAASKPFVHSIYLLAELGEQQEGQTGQKKLSSFPQKGQTLTLVSGLYFAINFFQGLTTQMTALFRIR